MTTGFSLAKYIKSSPGLMRMIQPVANAFANAAGHRKFGLRYDDIIAEENPHMQKVGCIVRRLYVATVC